MTGNEREERAKALHAAEYPPDQGFRPWEELSALVRDLWLAKADGVPDACDDEFPEDYE